MKRCLMAAFIKFTKRAGRGRTEEKQVAGPVHSHMKTDIVEWRLKEVATVEGFMEDHCLSVPQSHSKSQRRENVPPSQSLNLL